MINKGKGSTIGIALICIAVCALALFLSSGLRVHHGDAGRQEMIAANVAVLREQEQKEPVDIDVATRAKRKAELVARKGIMVDDLLAEQKKILEQPAVTKAELARRFKGAAIIGDSIPEDALNYSWLSDTVVFAKKGIRVAGDSEVVLQAINAKPSVMFFAFGVNDILSYGSNYSTFIRRYTACIENVQKALPETVIYVHAVFPPKTMEKNEAYAYLDVYNNALQEMCDQMGVFYIDGSFILKEYPNFYEKDQIHLSRKFYPLWLTYLADVAGLNGDE